MHSSVRKLSIPTILACLLLTCFFTYKQATGFDGAEEPYVLLVSLDGYRFDYTKKFSPPFLSWFINQGGSGAQSLRPVFPSKTFPSHFSIITGLYAEKHGIVSNSFYDHQSGLTFSIGNAEAKKAQWYGGTPIWTAAQAEGLYSASYFWPGSDVDDPDKRPYYFKHYKHNTSHRQRIDQVINWLKLPRSKRPRFLTLYFSDVDSAGHRFGPDSKELSKAVLKVDLSLKQLWNEISQLSIPVNLIIVSDHGMEPVDRIIPINLDQYIDINSVKIIGSGAMAQIYTEDTETHKTVLQQLKNVNALNAYSRDTIPKHYRIGGNPLIGEILIETKAPYYIFKSNTHQKNHRLKGNHGYNPFKNINMHGIFYARGPHIVANTILNTLDSISIYSFILNLLKVPVPQNVDGQSKPTCRLLKSPVAACYEN